jgi:hypothetical protein
MFRHAGIRGGRIGGSGESGLRLAARFPSNAVPGTNRTKVLGGGCSERPSGHIGRYFGSIDNIEFTLLMSEER